VTVVRTKKSRKEVLEIIGYLSKVASGQPDPYGLSEALYDAIVNSVLESGYNAAIVKSMGGVDDMGNSWAPLKKQTVAYKKKKWRRGLGLPYASRLRPTLTAEQNKQWKNIFKKMKYKALGMSVKKGLARLRSRRQGVLVLNKSEAATEADADAKAAAVAWSILKASGAKTLMMLANRASLPILNETGELLESMAPGSQHPAQYRIAGPGKLRIGSTLPQVAAFKARPYWPDNMGPWMARAIEAGRDALRTRLLEVLSS
jgi:hypothetical protein